MVTSQLLTFLTAQHKGCPIMTAGHCMALQESAGPGQQQVMY